MSWTLAPSAQLHILQPEAPARLQAAGIFRNLHTSSHISTVPIKWYGVTLHSLLAVASNSYNHKTEAAFLLVKVIKNTEPKLMNASLVHDSLLHLHVLHSLIDLISLKQAWRNKEQPNNTVQSQNYFPFSGIELR